MRKFSFKSKGARLRIIDEPKMIKNPWQMDRVVYVLILVFLSLALVSFLYKKINVVGGSGQIVFQKLAVNFTEDIRLTDIRVREGEQINKGDTLFRYIIGEGRNEMELNIRAGEVNSKHQKELLEVRNDLVSKQIAMNQVIHERTLLKNRLDELANLVLLEIKTLDELSVLQMEYEKLNIEEESLNRELELINDYYAQLRLINSSKQQLYNGNWRERVFQSPMDGWSGIIRFENNEVCYRENEVLSIHNPDKLQIRAYFNQKYGDDLQLGREVKVIFKDGQTSIGKITNIYRATYALPSEFQKKYEPTERNILIDLVPLSQQEEEIWRKYYLMEADLQILRWKV